MKHPDPTLRAAAVAVLLALVPVAALAAAAAAAPGALPPPGDCTIQLVAFSPCLPYVSSAPNNSSAAASSQCCEGFTGAFASDDESCFCYLVRQPMLLGFPLDAARILSLPSFCTSPANSTSPTNGTLEPLCSGLPPLPPLSSTTGRESSGELAPAGHSKPPNSGRSNSPSPSPNSTPKGSDSVKSPVRAPRLLPKPTRHSSATRLINNGCREILLWLMVFLVPIFSCL